MSQTTLIHLVASATGPKIQQAADVANIQAEPADGMCPDIGLDDFRVLAAEHFRED